MVSGLTTIEMELSQWLQPTVIVGLIGVIISLIVRATRLQSRVDDHARDLSNLKAECAKIDATISQHIMNYDLHYSTRLQAEIEKRQDDRFRRIEGRLGHIEEKLDNLLSR